jgi:capsular polysaccharide biosynthesis protein
VAIAYRLKQWLKSRLKKPWKALRRMPDRLVLIFARAAARFLPRLDIVRDSLYPPASLCSSTAEWVLRNKSTGADFRQIDVNYTAFQLPPKTIHQHVRQQLVMDQAYLCPETFVATIPNGRVVDEGLIITPDDQLLGDLSVDFRDSKAKLENVRREWVWRTLMNVDGTVAVLSTAGAMLYYHWLFQLLPRFELIRRSGIDLNAIDYFVVNSSKAKFQRESLKALGIDHCKIVESSVVRSLRARSLVVPSVPLSGGCFAPWMREFLRSTFLQGAENEMRMGTRRLYISRRSAGYRRVLNETDVIRLLGQFGFEEVKFEAMSIQQQAAAMASSECIVAPHGGGLSNLVFCRPTTKVIEIFSPELVAGYFWKLSSQLGLDYYYLLGKGPPAVSDANYAQSWNAHVDIEVDLDCLRDTLALANVHPIGRERAPLNQVYLR